MSNMVRMVSRTLLSFSLATLYLMFWSGLLGVAAAAQGRTAAHGDKFATESVKEGFKFEVVSIRPLSQPGAERRPGLTPDGYNSQQQLRGLIMLAYDPGEWFASLGGNGTTQISNAPQSIQDWYEINARVADEDREAWRNQSRRHELLAWALRDVLKDRFKLVIREQPAEFPGLLLVTRGKDVKLKASPPGSVLPEGRSLLSGGVAVGRGSSWHYYGASMEDLAAFLTTITVRPVADRTGLTGRYDFTIQASEHQSQDPEELPDNWPIYQLGLALKPGKVPGQILIIDHIEKPSQN